MRNILVLGGSGFVGSALIPKLLKGEHTVTVLNRGTKTLQGVIQIKADRNSKEALAAAMRQLPDEIQFDAVIDTSSYTLMQTQTAFELLAPKTKHWIHLSTAAVYKETEAFPKEDFPIGGAKVWGTYGVEKAAIDHFLLHQQQQLPATLLRPPYVYGPNNDNLRERFVWSRALQYQSIFVPADGTTLIQFLHVDDLADALVLCALTPTQQSAAYNIASEEKVSLRQWVAAVLTAGAMDAQVIPVGALGADFNPRHYFPFRDYPCGVVTGLLAQNIHWHPKYTTLVKGLQQTFASYPLEELSEKIPVSRTEATLAKRLGV